MGAAALVLSGALALSGCSDPDPQAQLRKAVEATLDDAFAFTVEVSGDESEPVGVEIAGLLDGAALRGARNADGEVGVAYEIGASAPLFEIRTAPDAEPLLRMGLADLLGIADDADPEAAVGPRLDERGVTGEQRAALLAGFVGDWIELEDVRAIGALAPDGAPAGAGDEDAEDPAGDGDWLDAVGVGEAEEDGETRTFRVQVDVEVLRQMLAARLGSPLLGPQVPSAAPGTVTVVGDRVTRVVVDLGAEDPGTTAMLQMTFDEHGTATLPARPEPVARVSSTDLAALVEILQPAG